MFNHNHRSTRRTDQNCNYCNGAHDTVPTEQVSWLDGDLGAYCPHCGGFHDLDADDPSELEPHPAVPKDEPITCVCHECNGSFRVQVN